MDTLPRPHLFGLLAGLFLAAGLCFASLVVARTWTHIHESQIIDVTGSARKNVRSDLVIWRGRFAVEDETLLGANEKLKTDLAKVDAFLRSKGVKEITIQPLQIREVMARTRSDDDEVRGKRIGYHLTQAIEVHSEDVEATPKLSRECTELLEQGVALVSEGTQFIYTKAGQAKIEMMGEATKDARTRAEQIASQGNRDVKELRSARMGVVQINPIFSTATSWEGNNDTTSLDKTMTVTVSAVFSLK
ncbi:MAG TPA: SIMPL domain-containing protein [Opitutaceae bacterium]|nr:SIMPL domain-containing protein [Opitutaceae bacterium]